LGYSPPEHLASGSDAPSTLPISSSQETTKVYSFNYKDPIFRENSEDPKKYHAYLFSQFAG
jgi:hypothetical protein